MSEGALSDLNAWLNREPFVPFQIVLTSGTTYEVHDPVQMIPGEAKYTYYFSRSDRYAIFRLNQIVTLETL
jgi:hypothetical protein